MSTPTVSAPSVAGVSVIILVLVRLFHSPLRPMLSSGAVFIFLRSNSELLSPARNLRVSTRTSLCGSKVGL